MSKESLYICECGSSVLAISHNWTEKSRFEQVGEADNQGQYSMSAPIQVDHQKQEDEWVAYCGGCGKGVTVEWISEGRVRILLDE